MTELLHSPLFGIVLTLLVHELASRLYRKYRLAVLNPVIITILVIIALLRGLDIPYQHYARGGDIILLLLGPAVVALAVPLYQRRQQVAARLLPILGGICAGAVVSMLSTTLCIYLLDGSRQLALTMAPKSVTTPIAIGIATAIGGIIPLTAAVVVITGCLGAIIGPGWCRLVGIDDPAAMGLAMGTAAHGIGTGRMLEIDVLGGAIAGLAIGINGLITAVLAPLLVHLLDLLY